MSHTFLVYFVVITGSIAIFYEILQCFIILPMVRTWAKSMSKDPDSPNFVADAQKLKESPGTLLCIMGCGCIGIIHMVLYYAWLIALLFIPGCLWFSLGLMCFCAATWVSNTTFGGLSKIHHIFGYIDTFITIAIIVLMMHKMIG